MDDTTKFMMILKFDFTERPRLDPTHDNSHRFRSKLGILHLRTYMETMKYIKSR